MTDTIAPALTPDEWKTALAWPHGIKDYLVRPAEEIGYGANTPRDLGKVMALTNAALPDDSEYKLTRADVEAINDALHRMEPYDQDRSYTPGEIATHARLVILPAKLAAFLPPETT